MAIRQANNKSEKRTMESAALYFHESIDGMEIGLDNEKDFAYLDQMYGIVAVTDSREILDEGYKPMSAIEKRLDKMFLDGGVNENDCVFTVEKDSYQTLVFEHAGQYQCSDWVLETATGNLYNTHNAVILGRLLVDELTVGGDALDRAFFYSLSKDMFSDELVNLQGAVRERVERFYRGAIEDHIALGGSLADDHGKKTERFIEGSLKHWFSPWTRLAGRMEYGIEAHMTRLGGETLDEKSLSSILLGYSRLDEYKPYLEKEFKGFVSNRCLDYDLDYMKMSPELRTLDLEKTWENDYPYLIESKEWDLLTMAYTAGVPCRMELKERPGFSNGFIGGDTSWSRYLHLVHGPTLPQGRVTGLGQIDYKDCTNAFVIFDTDKKAVFFDTLTTQQKHAVLERVFDIVKYSKKYQFKNKSVSGPKL